MKDNNDSHDEDQQVYINYACTVYCYIVNVSLHNNQDKNKLLSSKADEEWSLKDCKWQESL